MRSAGPTLPSLEDTVAPAGPASVDMGPSASFDETLDARELPRRARDADGPQTPGETLGRYVLLERIGAGAMGQVFAAFDRKLDRKIALKRLTRVGADASALAAALDEARAMARLNHRNVVQVYEAGTDAGQVYLAMEFVEGQSLGRWLAAEDRSWRAILAVFRAAAEGLAAAHEAGVIHRDFKPENVLVAADGTVKVIDFGVAQSAPRALNPRPGADGSGASGTDDSQLGRIRGTPAYMAPEQLEGRPVDARADIYAFCASLHEALYGVRPVEADSLTTLVVKVLAGERTTPTHTKGAPRWLRDEVDHGLARDPDHRPASMAALLATLDRGERGVRNRRWLVGFAGVAGLAAALVGVRVGVEQRALARCAGLGEDVSAAWEQGDRASVRAGLLATQVAHAGTSADKVSALLDVQVAALAGARVRACEHETVARDWTPATLTRAKVCLDERGRALTAVVGRLREADPDTAHRALDLAYGLRPVAPCLDVEALRHVHAPPEDAQLRERVTDVRAQLSEVRLLVLAAKYPAADEAAQAALASALASEWLPIVAEARVELGVVQDLLGDYEAAAETSTAAYVEAVEADAHDLAHAAASLLATIHYDKLERAGEGRVWLTLAKLIRARHMSSDLLAEAEDLDHEGNLASLAGDYAGAIPWYERAMVLRERALGPEHPEVGKSLAHLAREFRELRDLTRALDYAERALELTERSYGPDHPQLSRRLMEIGAIHRLRGDYEASSQFQRRTLAIQEQVYGADHPAVAGALSNLALARRSAGDLDEAIALYERALTIFEAKLGPEHRHVASVLNNLAVAVRHQGDLVRARALYERALVIRTKLLPAEHPDLAESIYNLGFIDAAMGDYDPAMIQLERAREIWTAALGEDNPEVAYALVTLAQVARAQGELDVALAHAERAFELREAAEVAPGLLAEAQWELVQCLALAQVDDARALALARQALVHLGEDPARADVREEIAAWLAARTG